MFIFEQNLSCFQYYVGLIITKLRNNKNDALPWNF